MWLHLVIVFAVHGFAAAVDARLHRPRSVWRVHRVDPNRARVGELALLPGVGPSRAEALVLERVRNGPFRSAADLRRVSGFGETTIAILAPWLTFAEETGR